MKLAVGTVVAYPPHGVGRIAARERRHVLGIEQEVVVLELASDFSVTLTLERALEHLRPLVDEAGLRQVRDTLRADEVVPDEIWSTRLKSTQAKLRAGDPCALAEIVRDGARRERAKASGGGPRLSVSERSLWLKARELLSEEIRAVRGLDRAGADAWIDRQLASP